MTLDDMASKSTMSQLSQLIKRNGGKYKGQMDDNNTLMFNVYTNLQFRGLSPNRNGISASAFIDTPPGQARSPNSRVRAKFWETTGSKRLMSGGLVVAILQRADGAHIYLGTISSSLREHVDSARHHDGATQMSISINFFDPSVELRILQELQNPRNQRPGTGLLIEATVMFESIRPFLDALRCEPTSVPFSRYLTLKPHEELSSTSVEPPAYATRPGFAFELASLCRPEEQIASLKLSVSNPISIETARRVLRARSCLDPSQADALVSALTNEVALIQG